MHPPLSLPHSPEDTLELPACPSAADRRAMFEPLFTEAALPPAPPDAAAGGQGEGQAGSREELPLDMGALARKEEEEEMRRQLQVRLVWGSLVPC